VKKFNTARKAIDFFQNQSIELYFSRIEKTTY